MTTLVFSSLGTIVGSALGIPTIGAYLGSKVGSYIDQKIAGINKSQKITGYRLDDLNIQTSTYGKTIPIIYGQARIAGNIIWATSIREVLTIDNNNQNGKGFARKGTKTEKAHYNYFIDIAIAICEGEIDGINRIWADNKLIDKNQLNYTLYRGSETQLPNSFMQSKLGTQNSPAYRGLAYILIQDFQLNEFGNRVPNFTFEVKRNLITANSVEKKIQAVNMIPGSGEFVYDTKIQSKANLQNIEGEIIAGKIKSQINNNTEYNLSDANVALSQMKETLPEVKWISVVVAWFTNSLNLQECKIYPAVEHKNIATSPDLWNVGGITRENAYLIGRDLQNKPNYGGTISDQALLNYLAELKRQGYKVMLYPMVFVDQPDKPWRGHITGKVKDVSSFFNSNFTI